jgi:hypothetical protein
MGSDSYTGSFSDDDPVMVNAYASWLYSSGIPSTMKSAPSEVIMAKPFKNAVVEADMAAISTCKTALSSKTIAIIYAVTLSSSLASTLVLQIVVC